MNANNDVLLVYSWYIFSRRKQVKLNKNVLCSFNRCASVINNLKWTIVCYLSIYNTCDLPPWRTLAWLQILYPQPEWKQSVLNVHVYLLVGISLAALSTACKSRRHIRICIHWLSQQITYHHVNLVWKVKAMRLTQNLRRCGTISWLNQTTHSASSSRNLQFLLLSVFRNSAILAR